MAETKQTKKEKRYWNKMLWSSIMFSFFSIFFILVMIFGKNYSDDKDNAYNKYLINAVISGAAALGSLVFLVYYSFKFENSTNSIYSLTKRVLIALSSFIPVVGVIELYVCKLVENKKVDPSKKNKTNLSAYTILFFVTLFVILIIWLIYGVKGQISWEVTKDDGSTEIVYGSIPGILDLFWAPIAGFIDAADLIIFLLVIGGFIQIVLSTKALDAGIGRLIKKMNGKEIWLIPILFLFFSVGGTTYGMCEETLAFYVVLIPVMLAAGFDTLTAVFTILFGAGLGTAASTINPFVISTAVAASNTGDQGTIVGTSDGIAWRAIVYVLFVIVGIVCITYYAYRVKKNPQKSLVYDLRSDHLKHFNIEGTTANIPFTGKRKATLWIFGITFLIMILMVINWEGITGYSGFDWLAQWLTNNLPFISTQLGAIGTWYLIEMSFLFFFSGLLVAIINWESESNYLQNLFQGAKDFLGVGVIIAIARGLSLILSSSGVNNLIVGGLSSMITAINNAVGCIVILFAIFLVLSFLIPSTSGFASAVFPMVGPAVAKANISGLSVAGTITTFSLANGWINLCSPTAGPFVAGCQIARVPLDRYYKSSWPLLVIFLVLTLAMLMIGTLIGSNLF